MNEFFALILVVLIIFMAWQTIAWIVCKLLGLSTSDDESSTTIWEDRRHNKELEKLGYINKDIKVKTAVGWNPGAGYKKNDGITPSGNVEYSREMRKK